MQKFSQRYGYTPVLEIKREMLEVGTINLLWNTIYASYKWAYRRSYSEYKSSTFYRLIENLWGNFLKRPMHKMPSDDIKFILDYMYNSNWFENFDLIEFIASKNSSLAESFNKILKSECYAYRFIDGHLTEITNEEEIKEIEIATKTRYDEASTHIKTALKHLSDRQNPDYRNSIKESISAVENVCRNLTGKSTLDEAIKKFKNDNNFTLNEQFIEGIKKIYNYTNGSDGIRHCIMEEAVITQDDAKFMLVLCCSFVNYIIAKTS